MQKAQTYTSPFGKAIYPHLSKCDVRFKPEGEYKVDLSLKDTQAQELIKVIKQYQLKAVAEAKEKTNKKKSLLQSSRSPQWLPNRSRRC